MGGLSDLGAWAESTGPRKPARGLDDVDEVAVERACRGDRTVPLNRAEMAEAFLWLDSHSYSHRQIAAILGVWDRTVLRWRSGQTFPYSRPPRMSRNGRSVRYSEGAPKCAAPPVREHRTGPLDPPSRRYRKEGPW